MNAQYPPTMSKFDVISLNRKLLVGTMLMLLMLMMPVAAYAAPDSQNGNCAVVGPNDLDRCEDLGDAPDSTNHAGMPMAAYNFGGNVIPGNFPTVFDPALGIPQGPRHDRPRLLHLGPAVSLEAEADQGPDQDPLNNIVPGSGSNNDQFDDGSLPSLWNLGYCDSSFIDVQIRVTPQAINMFAANGMVAYLNGWIDSDRDGDWDDIVQCTSNGQQFDTLEHMIIDYVIDVANMTPGLHTISVPTNMIGSPTQASWQRKAWVRLTLSELPSNKPHSYGQVFYGDGQGYSTEFEWGETEDYIYNNTNDPAAVQAAGLDSKSVAQEVNTSELFLPMIQQ